MHTYTYSNGIYTYTTCISGIRKACIASQRCSGRYGSYHVALCYDAAEDRVFTRELSNADGVIKFDKFSARVHFATLSVPTSQYHVASLLDIYSEFLKVSGLIRRTITTY